MNYIASNIKFLRTVAGLSQSDLAEQLGLNRGNITSYERDVAKPSIDTLPKIAGFFHVSLSDFIQLDLSQSMSRSQIEHLYANETTKHTAVKDKAHPVLPRSEGYHSTQNKRTNAGTEIPKKLQNLLADLNNINSGINANFYTDVNRIANSLETIATSLNTLVQVNKQQLKQKGNGHSTTMHTFM